MRFLVTVTLLTAAVVLLSKAAKAQKDVVAEGPDHDDDYEFQHRSRGTLKESYEDRNLYAEPSVLTIPEKHEDDIDRENRPEYASDNQPQLTVEALRRETNQD